MIDVSCSIKQSVTPVDLQPWCPWGRDAPRGTLRSVERHVTWIDVTKLHYITGVPGKHRGARGIDDSLGKLETSFAEIFFIFFCVACLDFPRDAPFSVLTSFSNFDDYLVWPGRYIYTLIHIMKKTTNSKKILQKRKNFNSAMRAGFFFCHLSYFFGIHIIRKL